MSQYTPAKKDSQKPPSIFDIFTNHQQPRGNSTRTQQAHVAIPGLTPSLSSAPKVIARKLTQQEKAKLEIHRAAISSREFTLLTSVAERFVDGTKKADLVGTKLTIMSFADLQASAKAVCNKSHKFPHGDSTQIIAYDPTDGTVDDLRLGTLSRDHPCITCNQNIVTCPGHIGYIPINPIVNPNYRALAAHIANSFCGRCFEPYFNFDFAQQLLRDGYRGLSLFERLSDECESFDVSNSIDALTKYARAPIPDNLPDRRFNHRHTPERCGLHRNKYTAGSARNTEEAGVKHTLYFSVDKEKEKRPIEPTQLLAIYNGINPEYLHALGIHGSIDGLITQGIVVLPPCTRPYGMINGDTKPHELTVEYSELIRLNNWYGEQQLKPGITPEKLANIQSEIYKKILNIYKMINEEIKGKEGIIRGVGMGKRVDYSGRSVLGPNNRIRFGEMAYPKVMARAHTKNVKVADFNIKSITELYMSGQITFITLGNATRLAKDRFPVTPKLIAQYRPQVGDTVDIIGQDGDETMFNRQPTLDKYSLNGYRAKYVDVPTIGVHSAYTSPHNADFDGDEGNKHKIQTLDARAEIRYFANVIGTSMSAKGSRPSVGLVYNCISSGYLMSLYTKEIAEKYLTEALGFIHRDDRMDSIIERLRIHRMALNTGRGLLSILFPSDFYYKHAGVEIVDGILVKGDLKASHLGPKQRSLFHQIWKKYGPTRGALFITEGQWLLDWFIQFTGFGVGFSSVSLLEEQEDEIREIVLQETTQVQLEIDRLGPATHNMTALEAETHENKIIGTLNRVKAIGKAVLDRALPPDNPIPVMSVSGAKGNESNTAQIFACLGQQFVKGKRPTQNLTDGTRCLPYYEPNTNDIEAHGFIKENFLKGSRPGGYIFHMMASRVGLIDTAVTTADSGHMQHRMMKTMEDFTVEYDGTVRSVAGNIYSCSYGDGYHPETLVRAESDQSGQFYNFIDIASVTASLNAAVERERAGAK